MKTPTSSSLKKINTLVGHSFSLVRAVMSTVSQESTTTIALNKEEEWAIVLVPETLTVD